MDEQVGVLEGAGYVAMKLKGSASSCFLNLACSRDLWKMNAKLTPLTWIKYRNTDVSVTNAPRSRQMAPNVRYSGSYVPTR